MNDTDKKIHDILRERQLIPVGMQLNGIEMMQFRAVWEVARIAVAEEIKNIRDNCISSRTTHELTKMIEKLGK